MLTSAGLTWEEFLEEADLKQIFSLRRQGLGRDWRETPLEAVALASASYFVSYVVLSCSFPLPIHLSTQKGLSALAV